MLTGKTLSNEVLVRVHEQRLKSRQDYQCLALELTSLMSTANAPIFRSLLLSLLALLVQKYTY
jgi:hypothetical protein